MTTNPPQLVLTLRLENILYWLYCVLDHVFQIPPTVHFFQYDIQGSAHVVNPEEDHPTLFGTKWEWNYSTFDICHMEWAPVTNLSVGWNYEQITRSTVINSQNVEIFSVFMLEYWDIIRVFDALMSRGWVSVIVRAYWHYEKHLSLWGVYVSKVPIDCVIHEQCTAKEFQGCFARLKLADSLHAFYCTCLFILVESNEKYSLQVRLIFSSWSMQNRPVRTRNWWERLDLNTFGWRSKTGSL